MNAAVASGVSAVKEPRVDHERQKDRFKEKHFRKMKDNRDDVDEERLDDDYD